jgi:long-chain acyl-CoA synthetase
MFYEFPAVVETIPSLLIDAYRKYGDKKIAMRKKERGIWKTYTYADYYKQVKLFSLGLVSLGFERGDRLAIIGDTDPQWYWAEIATQAAGGSSVGIYTDCVPSEVKYIIEHSNARFVVAKDQEQVDKVLSIAHELPNLVKVIYWEKKGLWSYSHPLLQEFSEVVAIGQERDTRFIGSFEKLVAACKPEDMALLSYTSGTTGLPKGTMLSHRAIVFAAKVGMIVHPLMDTWDYVAFLSPAWITDQVFGITSTLISGTRVNFPERADTTQIDIREVAPQFITFSARQWEGIISDTEVRISNATYIKRLFYNLFMPVGFRIADCAFNDKKPSWFYTLLWHIGNGIVFRPIRDKIGLLHTKWGLGAGAAMAPEVFRFYKAIGISIYQGYGLTEAPATCSHREGNIKVNTSGEPFPGVEVRISDDDEILVRGSTLFSGYYKDDTNTHGKIVNGWLRTGDAGSFDDDGHLIWIERMSDLSQLSSGRKFSPTFLEIRLRFSPYIRDIMVVGDETRNFVSAIVNIDFESVSKWAEKQGLTFTTFADLSQKKEVRELVSKAIASTNKNLPDYARVQKFANLHKEFDADDSELTRTRKLKRNVVGQRYQELINCMYENMPEYSTKAEIKYRDGRMGTVDVSININNVS